MSEEICFSSTIEGFDAHPIHGECYVYSVPLKEFQKGDEVNKETGLRGSSLYTEDQFITYYSILGELVSHGGNVLISYNLHEEIKKAMNEKKIAVGWFIDIEKHPSMTCSEFNQIKSSLKTDDLPKGYELMFGKAITKVKGDMDALETELKGMGKEIVNGTTILVNGVSNKIDGISQALSEHSEKIENLKTDMQNDKNDKEALSAKIYILEEEAKKNQEVLYNISRALNDIGNQIDNKDCPDNGNLLVASIVINTVFAFFAGVISLKVFCMSNQYSHIDIANALPMS